jgi:ADP-heptose:LPS heptosyltransferase
VSEVYVAPISLGLGDLVVSLPAIQALVAKTEDGTHQTWLVARSAAQAALAERIDGLTGWVDEASFDAARSGGRFIDLRDHPMQRDYWWGSPEFDQAYGPLAINDILEQISGDFGIDADFTRPAPLRSSRRPDVRDMVLLVTESDGPTKRWAAERWATVAEWARVSGSDARAVVRAAPAPPWHELGINEIEAPTPGVAVDLLSSCRAVVGIDTGLTHVAVQQGTPTVMLCRDRPVYFRPWPHSRVVVGGACVEPCLVKERELAYNATVSLRGSHPQIRVCPAGTPCMNAITPAPVIAALEALW